MHPSRLSAPLLVVILLTGCGLGLPSGSKSSSGSTGSTLVAGQATGMVHGGQQPVSDSTIQLYAVGTNGYGSAATPLISATLTSSDGSGLPDSNANAGNAGNTLPVGYFTITNDYTCPAGDPEVYIGATGGNPGLAAGTNNTAISMLAALGDCNTLKTNAATTTITINEVTTVASAYALARFTGQFGIGAYGYSNQGLLNAFATVNNLVNTSTGTARSLTPNGNGIVPQAEINTLANALVPCVNSTSSSSTACAALFSAASVGGSVDSVFEAALYFALNPGNTTGQPSRVSNIYGLSTANAAFQPALTGVPNDFTVALGFNSGGTAPIALAIDGVGNVWVSNYGSTGGSSSSLSMMSPLGVPATNNPIGGNACCLDGAWGLAIDTQNDVWVADHDNSTAMEYNANFNGFVNTINSIAGPFSGLELDGPRGVAIDSAGNLWFTNSSNNSITVGVNNGTGGLYNVKSDYTGGALNVPWYIAFDNTGNSWVTNYAGGSGGSINEVSQGGAVIPASSGDTGTGVTDPVGVAIDASNNVWITNGDANNIAEFNSSGVEVGFGITGGGITNGGGIAVDGAGNVWVADRSGNALSEVQGSNQAILSPAGGFQGGDVSSPRSLAIDESGNIWLANNAPVVAGGQSITVSEFIGLATPVITPLSQAVLQHQLGVAPGIPIPVSISSVDLPQYYANGSSNYGAQLYASGGNSGTYTWSSTSTFPAGLTLSTAGVISGTTTATGTYPLSIKACDTIAPNCATKSFTLSSTTYLPAGGNEAALNGRYAVRFTGVDSSSVNSSSSPGSVFQRAFVASLLFDSAGGITGEMDINDPSLSSVVSVSLTGSYSLGPDGRGIMMVLPSGLNTGQFAFSVGNYSGPTAQTIHFIDFDDTVAANNGAAQGSGIGELQTASAFTGTTLDQSFVFGLSGETPCTNYNSTNPSCAQTVTPFGPVSAAGKFTGNGSNSITFGEEDAAAVATTYTGITFTGTYTNPDTSGRGLMTLSFAGTLYPTPPSHFTYYIVNSGEMFMMSNDPHSTTTLLSGDVLAQSGSFSNSTVNGSYIVYTDGATGGDGLSLYPTQADAAIYLVAVNGGNTQVSLSGDENKGGSIRLNQVIGSAPYSVDSNGRMTLPPGAGVVFYLANSSGGFGANQPQSTGDSTGVLTMQQQTGGPFSNATIDGTYAFGPIPLPVFTSANSGVLGSTGNGTGTVTSDNSLNTGILALDEPDAYTFTVASSGRTTSTDSSGSTGILYVINPNTAVSINTNPSDQAPPLVFIQK